MTRETSEEAARGRADVEELLRHPSSLPSLQLGGVESLGRGARAVRDVLLVARVPPAVVGGIARLVPGRHPTPSGLVASHAYWTGVRKEAGHEMFRRLRRGVPILMYHGIGARGEPASRYVVPVERFRWQMRWLRRRSYNVLGLDELLQARAEFRLPPPKSVVITIDDGYLDNLTLARPILEELGLPATVFLVSAGGSANEWSTSDGVAGRPLMSLEDAREALGGTLTFGAHTRTHPRLTRVSPDEAHIEIAGSKEDLEAALGVPVTTFAYPYGDLSADVREAVVAVGFAGACSTLPGRNRPSEDGFALRRIEIRGTDSRARFAAALAFGELRRRKGRS